MPNFQTIIMSVSTHSYIVQLQVPKHRQTMNNSKFMMTSRLKWAGKSMQTISSWMLACGFQADRRELVVLPNCLARELIQHNWLISSMATFGIHTGYETS